MDFDKNLASAQDTSDYDRYYQSLVSRYGIELMEQSERYFRQLNKAKLEEIFDELCTLYAILGSMKKAGETPNSEVVQEMIHRHYSFFKKFGDFYNIPAYQQLAESYVQDKRYLDFFDDFAPNMATWLYEAICSYCEAWEKRLDPEERITPQRHE